MIQYNNADQGNDKPVVGKITIPDTTLLALEGMIDTEIANHLGYTHIIPSRWFDLARMGAIEKQFRALGIEYGKNDVYPAFRSKEELDAALLAVYESGWDEKWAIEDYLVEQSLIEKPKQEQ